MSLMRGVSLLTALLILLSCIAPDAAAQEPEGRPGVVVDAPALEKALRGMSAAGRARLLQAIEDNNFTGRIGMKDAKEIAAADRVSIEELMSRLLPLAKLYSIPPLTGYRVGVVAQGKSGALYLGANLEVPGTTLAASVHGEQSAIANAFLHEEEGVDALAVTAAPCGHCRQFLNELQNGSTLRILVVGEPPAELKSLLPKPFGPQDLGLKSALFKSPLHKLILPSDEIDELTVRALAAARRSYAPYTKSYAGVAVRTTGGRIFVGPYVENVAFNPSLSPLQAACVGIIFSGEQPANIAAVVLVEREQAAISQLPATRLVLEQMAPRATVKVVTARLEE